MFTHYWYQLYVRFHIKPVHKGFKSFDDDGSGEQYIIISIWLTIMLRGNISSWLSSNSEGNALELLNDIEEVFSL